MSYVDPQARVAALAIAVRRDPGVIDRLRTSEATELLSAALHAIPVTRRDSHGRPLSAGPRWRSTCPVLHDSAVYGYLRDGIQRCNLCDAEIRERNR